MSIPVLLPLRNGLKEPRYDGMELHGTDAGDAFRLGQTPISSPKLEPRLVSVAGKLRSILRIIPN